jgi:hypothetical protein
MFLKEYGYVLMRVPAYLKAKCRRSIFYGFAFKSRNNSPNCPVFVAFAPFFSYAAIMAFHFLLLLFASNYYLPKQTTIQKPEFRNKPQIGTYPPLRILLPRLFRVSSLI